MLGDSPHSLASTGGTVPTDGFSKSVVYQGPILSSNTALQTLGGFTSSSSAIVYCIQVDTVNNYVYVGGTITGFATSGAPCVVAQYNMTTSTWVDAGNSATTFDGTVIFSMILLSNQNLIVTGDFNNIGPSTVASGPWATYNPVSHTWAAMPGTYPFAQDPSIHGYISASVIDSSGTHIYLAGATPGLVTHMLLIYNVGTGVYTQVDTSNVNLFNSIRMCLDQTEQNLYINFQMKLSTSRLTVYNIAGNTLSAVSGGPTSQIYGMGLLFRNNVYYIAVAGTFTNIGAGVALYNATTNSFVNILSQTSGMTATNFRSLYVDYYNNLYVGSSDGTRFYNLQANSTVWVSPRYTQIADNTVNTIVGSGSASSGPVSARTLYIGGNFQTATDGPANLSGFARVVATTSVTSSFYTNGTPYSNLEFLSTGSAATLLYNQALTAWVTMTSSNTFSF
jgi:hypothetical protein